MTRPRINIAHSKSVPDRNPISAVPNPQVFWWKKCFKMWAIHCWYLRLLEKRRSRSESGRTVALSLLQSGWCRGGKRGSYHNNSLVTTTNTAVIMTSIIGCSSGRNWLIQIYMFTWFTFVFLVCTNLCSPCVAVAASAAFVAQVEVCRILRYRLHCCEGQRADPWEAAGSALRSSACSLDLWSQGMKFSGITADKYGCTYTSCMISVSWKSYHYNNTHRYEAAVVATASPTPGCVFL